jgi:SAM-dependent methyltransferase
VRNIPFSEYLRAKIAIDDRSLNRWVLETARRNLPQARPLRVLEAGAGIGSMLTRLLAWDFLPAEVDYIGVDADPANAPAAVEHWRAWAHENGYVFEANGDGYRLCGRGHRVRITWYTDDMMTFAAGAEPDRHLLLAHAFLDLVHLPTVLPALFRLAPGGLFYFTLNFDGVTVFEPETPGLDDEVLEHYHRTMDERRANGLPAGESRTGRRLLTLLPSLGAEILAAGSSDWVVYPRHGSYPPGEAIFLHAILDFVEKSLTGRPGLNSRVLAEWLKLRRTQVDAGELTYMAHQLDFAGRVPESPGKEA